MSTVSLLPGHAGLNLTSTLILSLFEVAEDQLRKAAAARKKGLRRRTKRNCTRRPGVDTPLWNGVAAALRVQLNRRGEKAKMARTLGLPRQRLHEFLQSGSAMPDAERALFLLCWLAAKEQGRELIP